MPGDDSASGTGTEITTSTTITTTSIVKEDEEEDVDVDALEDGMVVIDEDLVRTCLWKMEEQIEGDEPERVAEFKQSEQRDVDFQAVEELRMSYESIFAIDNLEGFANLRVLALDNNCIKRMVNLEPLVRGVGLPHFLPAAVSSTFTPHRLICSGWT